MIDALGPAVIALTAAVGVMVLALTIIRVLIRRGTRRETVYRPAASRALASYMAGLGPAPHPVSKSERGALHTVALNVLTDLVGAERGVVAALLADLGYVGEAIAALGSRRRSRRRRAAEELALIEAPGVSRALTAGLNDKDPLVRTSCARTLAETGDPRLAPRIADVAARDLERVPGAAAAVLLELGRHHPSALEPLLRRSVPAPVRTVTVTVAGRLRLAELTSSLRGCLSADGDIAAAAAEGLGLIGDAGAIEALSSLAADHARPMKARAAAAAALGAIGDPGAAAVLAPLLSAPDWTLRAVAARALGGLGEPGTTALRRAVSAGPAPAREQAQAVLGR